MWHMTAEAWVSGWQCIGNKERDETDHQHRTAGSPSLFVVRRRARVVVYSSFVVPLQEDLETWRQRKLSHEMIRLLCMSAWKKHGLWGHLPVSPQHQCNLRLNMISKKEKKALKGQCWFGRHSKSRAKLVRGLEKKWNLHPDLTALQWGLTPPPPPSPRLHRATYCLRALFPHLLNPTVSAKCCKGNGSYSTTHCYSSPPWRCTSIWVR